MKTAVVFGAGEHLKKVLPEIETKYNILCIADNNPAKHNTLFEKYKIVAPYDLVGHNPNVVIVTSINFGGQIFSQLLHMGISEERIICKYIASIRRVYIKDLMNMQINGRGKFNRVDIIAKYDVIKSNIEGIPYDADDIYIKMQQERLNITFSEAENRLQKFKTLYESIGRCWEESEKNCIVCDERLQIMDGAHRLACCLYYGIQMVDIKVVPGNVSTEYSMTWFWEHGFSADIINGLKTGITELTKQELMIYLWPTAERLFESITADIREMSNDGQFELLEIVDVSYETESERNQAIRAIYQVDDIAGWKIDAKIEHTHGNTIRSILLKTDKPEYRIKQATGLSLSVLAEEIKRGIRGRYKDKVEDYFFDNIIHVSDNGYQTELIKKGAIIKKDISDYFKNIQDLDYVLLKREVPYMPDVFPKNFAVGKDLDILCSKAHMEQLAEISMCYAQKYAFENKLSIRTKEEPGSYRIRLEYLGSLILQIDLRSSMSSVKEAFWTEVLQYKKSIDGYKVPEEQYEAVIRFEEIVRNPGKVHHRNWIITHFNDIKMDLIRKYLKYDWRIIEECLSDLAI